MKRTMFDKLMTVTLTGMLAFSLAACANGGGNNSGSTPQQESAVEESETDENAPDNLAEEYDPAEEAQYDTETAALLVGGWEKADSPVITEDMKALVEKASANLTGTVYTPAAYLARQVVAGTNHLFLCRAASSVDPDAVETYMFVTIYEDLEGNAQITNVIDTDQPTNIAELAGGWQKAESPEVTQEIRDLCDKAFEKLTGVDYKPVALLSTQVVAGTNYCLLCESTIVYPGADTTYAFVYLYEDLEGNVEVLDIMNCDQNGAVTGATIAE